MLWWCHVLLNLIWPQWYYQHIYWWKVLQNHVKKNQDFWQICSTQSSCGLNLYMPCAVLYLDSAYFLLFKNGILEECQFTGTHGRTQMCLVVCQNSEQKLHVTGFRLSICLLKLFIILILLWIYHCRWLTVFWSKVLKRLLKGMLFTEINNLIEILPPSVPDGKNRHIWVKCRETSAITMRDISVLLTVSMQLHR